MKTFTFAGTCTENGATVYKFANDANRAKALERFGCTDVNMIELPEAMDKEAAVAFLATKGMTAGKAPRVAKAATVAKASKATKTKLPKVEVAKKSKRKPVEYKEGMDAEKFIRAWFNARPTWDEIEKSNEK